MRVRMNNSNRPMPETELGPYIADHWRDSSGKADDLRQTPAWGPVV